MISDLKFIGHRNPDNILGGCWRKQRQRNWNKAKQETSNLVPASTDFLLGLLLDPEYGGYKFLRNVRISPHYTALEPRKPHISGSRPRENQIHGTRNKFVVHAHTLENSRFETQTSC
jgi:hypothetical protein